MASGTRPAMLLRRASLILLRHWHGSRARWT